MTVAVVLVAGLVAGLLLPRHRGLAVYFFLTGIFCIGLTLGVSRLIYALKTDQLAVLLSLSAPDGQMILVPILVAGYAFVICGLVGFSRTFSRRPVDDGGEIDSGNG
jgi:hypothetical protein